MSFQYNSKTDRTLTSRSSSAASCSWSSNRHFRSDEVCLKFQDSIVIRLDTFSWHDFTSTTESDANSYSRLNYKICISRSWHVWDHCNTYTRHARKRQQTVLRIEIYFGYRCTLELVSDLCPNTFNHSTTQKRITNSVAKLSDVYVSLFFRSIDAYSKVSFETIGYFKKFTNSTVSSLWLI